MRSQIVPNLNQPFESIAGGGEAVGQYAVVAGILGQVFARLEAERAEPRLICAAHDASMSNPGGGRSEMSCPGSAPS